MATSRRDPLDLAALGNLDNYTDDELAQLRERLIEDITRVEEENRRADARIRAFNIRKQELNEERAERARAIRAVKHQLNQRQRRFAPTAPRAKLRAAR